MYRFSILFSVTSLTEKTMKTVSAFAEQKKRSCARRAYFNGARRESHAKCCHPARRRVTEALAPAAN